MIFSQENSQGKTTLLRLIIYALGYKIPDTKSIKFANCFVECKVNIRGVSYTLFRQGDYFEVVNQNNERKQFVLQDEQDDLQKQLFGVDNLYIQKGIYERELKSIKTSYGQNQSFKNYIEKMRLSVINEDGVEIPVNSKTIKNFLEITELLKARQKVVAAEIAAINRRIASLDVITEDNQIKLMATSDILKEFDKKISTFDVDHRAIQDLINALEDKRSSLKKQLSISTKINNEYLSSMYKTIEGYAKELSLEKHINLRTDFIFTHNLKELSGAILHKIVFAFKLGYIFEVEKQLGFKLPIILDSPSGKEVDPKNIEKMFEILKRDFSDHQIIVASIHDYQNFENKKIHVIEERLIDQLSENN